MRLCYNVFNQVIALVEIGRESILGLSAPLKVLSSAHPSGRMFLDDQVVVDLLFRPVPDLERSEYSPCC